MGDRANVLVKENDKDKGVFLYTHWAGSDLPTTLRCALRKRWRWNDHAYLTRIILDTMTGTNHGTETSFGVATSPCDGHDRVLVVDVGKQEVSVRGFDKSWTFEEYVNLSDDDCVKIWGDEYV